MTDAAREVEPLARPPDAIVRVPGSKSLTNRALVCAALAGAGSELIGALDADDTAAMRSCLLALDRGTDLDARASGTTSRFVLPLLAAREGRFRLDGAPSLRARPMAPLFDALRSLGASVHEDGDAGHLPVTVSGGPVRGGRVEVPGDITSQFLSGLLLVGPSLRDGIEVVPTTTLVSRPYLDMTAAVMRAFGARVDGLRAEPGGYRPARYTIEPDASAASYFFAAAAITGGRVTVEGLGSDSLQGDLRFVEVLAQMGAQADIAQGATTVIGPAALHGVDVDLRDLPDMAQTLAAVAVFADAPTRVRGVGFIRGHETDRIRDVVAELQRLGIEAHEHDDGFTVVPGNPQPGTVQTYDDHRMAMSFALLGLRVPGISIADPGCVSKTFPGFFEALEQLR
jgi:3-phosphoshikimate 1-carboxyvinyltransferase